MSFFLKPWKILRRFLRKSGFQRKKFGKNQKSCMSLIPCWGTGGAGFHWYGNWYRYHPVDFKERTSYGKGLDWPIEYSDLKAHYNRAQAYFAVSGDLSQEPLVASGQRLQSASSTGAASITRDQEWLRRIGHRHVPQLGGHHQPGRR